MAVSAKKKKKSAGSHSVTSPRFEAAKLDALFVALDAVAWLDSPAGADIAQFAGIDPRTAGKLLKNAVQIGLLSQEQGRYALLLPYPYKGDLEQKKAVVHEALVRLPLLASVRQFMQLGDHLPAALRKAATVCGIAPFKEADFGPLVVWASSLGALDPGVLPEDLVESATAAKVQRHSKEADRRVAFLSHSSKDKPFIRQLAGDLTAMGVAVWLDEQRIRVGDSIPDQIAQGLAESDYFLFANSKHSSASEWVKRELNNALVAEIEKRKVRILPLKLDDAPLPNSVSEKKYADFSVSYKFGLDELAQVFKESVE